MEYVTVQLMQLLTFLLTQLLTQLLMRLLMRLVLVTLAGPRLRMGRHVLGVRQAFI